MNYGLYLSASGVLTNMHRQDVHSNNLANAQTTGFKRNMVSFRHRAPEAYEDGPRPTGEQLLNKLGGGIFVNPSTLDASNGDLRKTGNELDVGIRGNGFMVVDAGEGANQNLRLTRDGRLTLGSGGALVTQAGGHEVQSAAGGSITLDPGQPVQVDEEGVIRQGGDEVARIRLAQPDDASKVKHLGSGLYMPEGGGIADFDRADGRFQQGFVEASNVDPISELQKMISASKSVGASGQLIRYHDHVLDRAVNVLGRVA